MKFDNIINTRASIKRYSSKKPPIEKVLQAVESATHAPSPGNLHLLKYIIIDNVDTIYEISEACQQEFIKKAPFLVIVCSDSQQAKTMYDERAKTYIKQHAGASIENFLLKITEMKLASCWVGAFSDTTIKRILNIPGNIEIEAVLPVAYQLKTESKKQKPKIQLDRAFFFHKYGEKFKTPLKRVRRTDL
ncbi:nitroreductase family protein [archaeon]|jgi:nitroreductase|nr:nitroreductase family protein [Candidatus Woesearchaeota archaeon]MBT4135607.1 nitroreductase family protein [archaeon]MBT4241840.1 nitroreductase family protein [archaeon]MBT4418387.1 nitroreductase family protein [archaeon]